MEAARALADLVEISPQIDAAIVFGGDGDPVGSVGLDEARAGAVARAGRALLEAAAEGGGRVTQVHASLGSGDVFAVARDSATIVAVTSRPQAPGLVLYDLKRCLAALAEPEPEPGPATAPPRRGLFRKGRDA